MRKHQIGYGIHIAHFCRGAASQCGTSACGFDQHQIASQAIYTGCQRQGRGVRNHVIRQADAGQGRARGGNLRHQLCLGLRMFLQHGLRVVFESQARTHNGLPQGD